MFVAVLVFAAWFIRTNLTGTLQQVCLAILVIAFLFGVLSMLGLLGGLNTRVTR